MFKQTVCKLCEKQCILDIDKFDSSVYVEGNNCEKGEKYAKKVLDSDKEILTTLVRIKGADVNVIPVKSTKPVDKKILRECSKALSRINVGAPIKVGDIVCKNILNTGVDIICIKNANKS